LLFDQADFNDAGAYFAGRGAAEWADLEVCIESLPLYLQPSGQRAKVGQPIFDPKATNAYLTNESHGRGWRKVPVPAGLTEFGTDWDAGKHETLAEWQFSNYPFLWNNVIRSEAVFQGMMPIAALVVVTKSGMLPASNSTLYFEQARAQLNAVTTFGAFDLPIRLVGLRLAPEAEIVPAVWTSYPGRYGRSGAAIDEVVNVSWGFPSKYGVPPARFTRP
jgi:hypothetical protein